MNECVICLKKFESILVYNRHCYIHRSTKNARFVCRYDNCAYQFVKYGNFKMHIRRKHFLNNDNKQDNTILCAHCKNLIQQSDVLRHVLSHLENDEIVKCPYQYCSQVMFSNMSKFKSHYYRNHSLNIKERKINSTSQAIYQYEDFDQINESDTPISKLYTETLAKIYLNLQANHFVTDNVIDAVAEGLSTLNNVVSEYTGQTEMTNINSYNVYNSSHSLKSKYMRKKFYKNNFNYISPICIPLGRNNEHELCFYFYIPLLETLKNLLENENVKLNLSSNAVSDCNVLKDITDGQVYKNNSFFNSCNNRLRLILYQDAFEICNPLGSYKKKHKLVGIYLTLGNLLPYNRSKVDHIQLVALCYERHVSYFGFPLIFKKLLEDVKILESVGIELNSERFFGSLIFMIGDNLGSHQIGGFTENFSKSKYFCRFCYITRSDLHNGDLFPHELRTIESHNIDETNMQNKIDSRGVNKKSCLNDLMQYHVCNPGLPPCFAHDIYEGIAKFDLLLIFNYFVNNGNFTYNFLNAKLNNIKFTHNLLSGKIAPITRKKITGNAHQILKLIQILPFAIFTKIKNYSDKVWLLLLNLRDICNLLLSVKISIGQIAYLDSLIHKYLNFRIQLFPQHKLRPKHHYLTHYAALIRQCGPLRNLWTLRHESKHKYFKTVISHCQNYKNVAATLSEKHQLRQAILTSQKTLFSNKVIADEAITFNNRDYCKNVQTLISNCKFGEPFFISDNAVINSISYKKNMHIVTMKNEWGLFVLCKIRHLVISNDYNSVFIIGEKVTIELNHDIGLYELNCTFKDSELMCIDIESCCSHEPVLVYTSKNDKYFYFQQAPFDYL